ncbi:hypothetical protein [Methylobacterium sp. Gmos1]
MPRRFVAVLSDEPEAGRRGLDLGDCLHSESAKYERVPILAMADEFRQTDPDGIP